MNRLEELNFQRDTKEVLLGKTVSMATVGVNPSDLQKNTYLSRTPPNIRKMTALRSSLAAQHWTRYVDALGRSLYCVLSYTSRQLAGTGSTWRDTVTRNLLLLLHCRNFRMTLTVDG